MIDYFALLDQPRVPWLDPDKLKETYHRKTLLAHPDTQASRGGADITDGSFANLNEAYQVLQDPKRRVHHLLSLEGCAPSSTDQTVPRQLHDLFPRVGALTQRAKLLSEKIQAASNALSRSLLKAEILQLQNETKTVKDDLQRLYDDALLDLKEITPAWSRNRSEQNERLSNLYFAFAYLTRWNAQLEEMQFQLSLY